MQQWFYEMYGFYPLAINDGIFYLHDLKYELIPIVDDEPWAEYEQMLSAVCQHHQVPPVVIVKNRFGQYGSSYQNTKYLLVCGTPYDVSLREILAMHEQTGPKQPLNLSAVRIKWISRIDQIEYEILPWLPPSTKDFNQLVVATTVGLGMAENAVLYLSSLPPGVLPTCLCNKRIDDLNSWVVYNPSHVVLDHPVRDLADLVKMNVLTEDALFGIIAQRGLNEVELSYLVARLLYPFQLFDDLESLYTEERKELGIDMVVHEFETKRILRLIKRLLLQFSLRPIDWILMV